MNNENITITNLDNYLNDFLQRDQKDNLNQLSPLDIECMYIEHLAKAYGMLFDSLDEGVAL